MAKKRKKNTSRKKRTNMWKDDRLRLILGLTVLFFALFTLLAFISYFFTWKTDQSFEWSSVFSNPDIRVDNWSGKSGAWISNLMINKWFGITAVVFPFILILLGFSLLKLRIAPLGRTIVILIIGAFISSLILGLIFGTANGFLGSGPGGAQGYLISQWLIAFIGNPGAIFLMLILTLSYIMFAFNLKPAALMLKKENLIKSTNSGDKETDESEEDDEPITFTENVTRQVDGDDKLELTFENSGTPEKATYQGKDKVSPAKEKKQEEEPEIELTVAKREENDDQESDKGPNHAEMEEYDPTLELSGYKLPPVTLLEDHAKGKSEVSNEELINNKNKIVETLANYKIQIDKIKATIGPTITLYEIVPAPGIRISKIKNLEDDIALSLAALGIRIIAPIPGRGTIGIEVPNQNPEIVSMKSIIATRRFQEAKYELAVALGKNISNETYVFDLTKMPHLLVAGATGQGKSVGLNAILTSLLYRKHPSQLKFVLIDPKKVELTLYSKIEKHFLAKLPDADEPIITDTQKVINTLNSLTIEMDNRYNLLKKAHVRNIKEYNAKFIARKLNPENGHHYLPYIVVVIDEFADLIMTAGREVETPIARLAQLARAIGIHLIIATQRPTTNIITGVIKANFPARIAFRVTSMIDSRTILDSPGANQLIGRGDMLISDGGELTRIQCAFIDIPELDRITDYIKSQQSYPTAFMLPEYQGEEESIPGEVDLSNRDSMFEDAARLVVIHQQGSTSLIQRKFSIGYNRAGRIMDQLEAAGIVGESAGSKSRQVLVPDEYNLEQILTELNKL